MAKQYKVFLDRVDTPIITVMADNIDYDEDDSAYYFTTGEDDDEDTVAIFPARNIL